jgi:hypothetical protein
MIRGYSTMQSKYADHDPKGWCGDPSRGAALGRGPEIRADADFDGKVTLRRIRLHGDYDSLGTYWGQGEPLYWYVAVGEEGYELEGELRAGSRDDAKAAIRAKYPKARFYR